MMLRYMGWTEAADLIIDGMNGNICRCGTYSRIKKAINRVVAER